MANVLQYAIDTYGSHLSLILLFSISLIIASVIPLFAAFPTYSDMGGIFIRNASIFYNVTPLTAALIVFSTVFSLLFFSFGIVAINVVVKHKRTYSRIKKEVINGLERYTAKVFAILLLFTAVIILLDILSYMYSIPFYTIAVIGLVLTPLFFYAPSSIVIDDNGILRSMKASVKHFFKRLDYVGLWLIIAIVLLTALDFIFIGIAGISLSRYVLLIVNALFVLPFLILLQSECYLRRFGLLKG
jgi:hypothetical protein